MYIHILVKGTIRMVPLLVPPPSVNPDDNVKEVVFKNCAPYTDCISKIKKYTNR